MIQKHRLEWLRNEIVNSINTKNNKNTCNIKTYRCCPSETCISMIFIFCQWIEKKSLKNLNCKKSRKKNFFSTAGVPKIYHKNNIFPVKLHVFPFLFIVILCFWTKNVFCKMLVKFCKIKFFGCWKSV